MRPASLTGINLRSRQAARYRFRLRVTRGADIAVGPGKIDLLEAIGRTGSISAAARALHMSYRRAWLLVQTMNRCFKRPVVAAEVGGSRGGGAKLTPAGEQAVRHYRRIERMAADASAAEIRGLVRLLRR